MIAISIFKGVILDLDLQTLSRAKTSKKALVMNDLLIIGTRKAIPRKGYILTNTIVTNDNLNSDIVVPRQEPLEYSWKKMNK